MRRRIIIWFLLILNFFILLKNYNLLFIFIFLFISEYLYIINFCLNVLFPNYYYILFEIKKKNPCDLHITNLWFNICESIAFLRLYTILNFIKPSKLSILIITFCLFLSLPIRLLTFTYNIINHKIYSKKDLEKYYLFINILVRNKKIEIFENEIYLNCHTQEKLIKEIGKNTKSYKDPSKIFNLIYQLKLFLFKQSISENKKLMEFEKSIIYNEDLNKFVNGHFTVSYSNYFIHPTSNINFNLWNTQFLLPPMGSVILPYATNPGTVATLQEHCVLTSLGEYIWIPESEVYSILKDNKNFNIPIKYIEELYYKEKYIGEIFTRNGFEIDKDLIKNLALNHVNNLIQISDNEMIELSFKISIETKEIHN